MACSETVIWMPVSTSICPRSAEIAPSARLESERVIAELLLALSCDGCSAPIAAASSVVVAVREAVGVWESAVDRAMRDGLVGDNAGPSGVLCVASARFAAAEAIKDGESAAGVARSRFLDSPTPAVPTCPLANAVRAGLADGSPCPSVDWAIAGLSTETGEDAASAVFCARRGVAATALSGEILGAFEVRDARLAEVCATWDEGLADATSSVGCVRAAAASLGAVCRETVALEAAKCWFADCTGDWRF